MRTVINVGRDNSFFNSFNSCWRGFKIKSLRENRTIDLSEWQLHLIAFFLNASPLSFYFFCLRNFNIS